MAEERNRWLTELRAEITQLAKTKSRLDALLEEKIANGWTLADADFTGENDGITAVAADNVLNTIGAIDTLWEAGHKTNVYALYRRAG